VQAGNARRRRLRRGGLGLAAVLLVAANAFVLRDLVVTHTTAARVHDDAVRTEAQLDATRTELSRLAAYRSAALAVLGTESARRDLLLRQDAAIRAALGEKTSAIVAAYAQMVRQNQHMVSLSTCLQHVQAAMNTVSVGDWTNGSIALSEVRRLCGATAQ
jgi:hypothetical protein